MTIGAIMHPFEHQEEVIPEGKRLRMKDWLKIRIGNPRYPGLVWIDEEKQIFKIPWKHAALHGWDQNSDGALFRDWAQHTGSCVHNAHPKTLKATFRCALHSLPDVHEDKSLAKKRGDDACRVFRFSATTSSAPRKRHIRIRNHKKPAVNKNLTRSQINEATKAMNIASMNYAQSALSWDYPTRSNPTQVISNTTFSPGHISSNGVASFQPQSASWALPGNRGSYSSSVTPPDLMRSTSGFDEGFKPIHQSLSDSNISPSYDSQGHYTPISYASQCQSANDMFQPKYQFDVKTIYEATQQHPASPTSTCSSNPGTPQYCASTDNILNTCGQSCSPPGSVYSSSFNSHLGEPLLQNNQMSACEPLMQDYFSNVPPTSTVNTSCPTSCHIGSDFMPLPSQQNAVESQCSVIPAASSTMVYEVPNGAVADQGNRSPYCGDTISSTVLPPVTIQQAVDDFAFVSSNVVQQNRDSTIATKEVTNSKDIVVKDSQSEMPGELPSDETESKEELDFHFPFPLHLLGNDFLSGFYETDSGLTQRTKLPAIETLPLGTA